jgi:hypothetical protein
MKTPLFALLACALLPVSAGAFDIPRHVLKTDAIEEAQQKAFAGRDPLVLVLTQASLKPT